MAAERSSKPRLRLLRPEELTPEQQAVHQAIAGGRRAGGPFPLVDAAGSLRGPFNAMLLSPALGLALQSLGAAVRYDTSLTDRVRELAILAVAAEWGSDFEREAHEAVGRGCGLTEEDFQALRQRAIPQGIDAVERSAVEAARALVRHGALSDSEYAAAMAALGERGLFELTALVGYYSTLALQLRVFAGEGYSRTRE